MRYLIELATPRLQASQVVDPRTGRLIPIRSARRAAAFPLVLEDPCSSDQSPDRAATARPGRRRAGASALLPPGEEYKLHSDALPPGPNQRIVTVLVALNQDYDGGATRFPALGFAWRGRTGEALVFRNVDVAGTPDSAARHAGCPVERGTKFLLSRWIREHPLDLSGPPGRPF
jgi:prolyl 4-hydroxylase